MKCLVERAAGRVEPLGEHVERHAVQRERDQYLLLVLGQAIVDRALQRQHQLVALGLPPRTLAGVRHQRPGFRLEHHLAFLPGAPAQTHPASNRANL